LESGPPTVTSGPPAAKLYPPLLKPLVTPQTSSYARLKPLVTPLTGSNLKLRHWAKTPTKFFAPLEKCVDRRSKPLDIVQKTGPLSENSSPPLVSQACYGPMRSLPKKL